MSYTDSLLAQGEVIARRDHQHWLALFLDSRAALGVWIVAALLFAANLFFRFSRDVSNIVGIIVLALVVIGLVIFLYQLLKWRTEDYLVTNRRILKVTGIVNKRSADSSLEKINDLVLEENLLGRMMGYGDLDIITAADTAIDRFRMLRDAKEFKRVMLEQKHRLETGEDIRMPGPPLMASSADMTRVSGESASVGASPVSSQPSSGDWRPTTGDPEPTDPGYERRSDPSGVTFASQPAPTPSAASPVTAPADPVAVDPLAAATASQAGASAPPPSGSTTSDEPQPADAETLSTDTSTGDEGDDARGITQTLSRLADLRDRGAITPEEYEQKKTELLGRL